MLQASVLALLAQGAVGHGWLARPVSKNEFSNQVKGYGVFPSDMPTDFRYCPDCANENNRGPPYNSGAGSCGAKDARMSKGRDLWQKWYDQTGKAVPELVPGSDMDVRTALPADHGGQAWFMIACGTEINEGVNWTILERSMDDRTHHFMPSSPSIYAWRKQEFTEANGSRAKYHVPSSFSCPDDKAVGRWVWKCSNVCNDVNNVGRSTTTFLREEYQAVVGGNILRTCDTGVEHFISCVDFKFVGSSSPTPPSPSPQPTQAPTTAQPTPVPTTPAPVPTPEPTTQAPPPAPTTAPPTPAPAPSCCKWSSNCGGGCASGYCSKSQSDCRGCGGTWCAPSLLGAMKPHKA